MAHAAAQIAVVLSCQARAKPSWSSSAVAPDVAETRLDGEVVQHDLAVAGEVDPVDLGLGAAAERLLPAGQVASSALPADVIALSRRTTS